MKARDYIIEHIPTMVRDEHVSGMKLTTLVALLNGYHESEVKKLGLLEVVPSKSNCLKCGRDTQKCGRDMHGNCPSCY